MSERTTIHNPFALTVNVDTRPCGEPLFEVILTNNSGFDIANFSICFTLTRDLISEKLVGGTLQRKEGSHHEITPNNLKDNTLKDGQSWVFSGQNTTMPVHITDGALGAFLKINGGESFIALGDAHTNFLNNNVVVNENMPPQYPASQDFVPIVPRPNSVVFGNKKSCPLHKGFHVKMNTEFQNAWDTAVQSGVALWKSYNPIFVSQQGTPLSIVKNDKYGKEGYKLELTSHEVIVETSTQTGCYYALMSLTQMCRGYITNKTVEIIDEPFFGYRGQHFDVARQFYTVDEVKRFIDVCAFHKINVLHWHLTDDEAWRVEIKGLPDLTEKLSQRGADELVPQQFGSSYQSYGGYYTQDDIRDMVAYADNRGMEVIPEIDMPGHCFGLVNAIEQLVEKNDNSQYTSTQNYNYNTLNPGLPATYEILEKIIKEVAELFPSPYLHIGADERPESAWLESPACQALMERENLKDGHAIQTYFIKKIHKIVRKYGKIMGAWEEATEDGNMDSDLYIVSWRNSEAGIRGAAKGHDVVMSPAQYLYFDMAQSEHPLDPGLIWAGHSDVVKTYSYDPLNCSDELEITDAIRTKIKGIQGCLWSESLYRKKRVEFMMFPRLCAMAEVAWTKPENKCQQQFLYNVQNTLFPLFDCGNVGYRPFDYITNHSQYSGRI